MADFFGRLAKKFTTPELVQKFIRSLDYNSEPTGETLRSAQQTVLAGRAHCLEGAFVAAAILERHDHPPLVISMESQDYLDHVIYVFQQNGLWGSIAQSRDEGLHGRKPVFKNLRQLCWSYYEPFIDKTGRLKAYQVFHLDEFSGDWRHSKKNVWPVQNYMCEVKHIKLPTSQKKYFKLLDKYNDGRLISSHPTWW